MVKEFTSNFAFDERKHFPRKFFNAVSLPDTIEEQILFLQFKH